MVQQRKHINMKTLFLFIFILISTKLFSQNFGFEGNFQLISQEDYDFNKVKVYKNKFILNLDDEIVSEYLIIGEDSKIGYKMINKQDNSIIYVHPILINKGRNLKAHIYINNSYKMIYLERIN
jgi:hypothetical protein